MNFVDTMGINRLLHVVLAEGSPLVLLVPFVLAACPLLLAISSVVFVVAVRLTKRNGIRIIDLLNITTLIALGLGASVWLYRFLEL